MTELDSVPSLKNVEPAPQEDNDLDKLADKLGSYMLARIQCGLEAPIPATHELPGNTDAKGDQRPQKPSGHVRFSEPGAADQNLAAGHGMTEWLTPEQIATNRRGIALVRLELALQEESDHAE